MRVIVLFFLIFFLVFPRPVVAEDVASGSGVVETKIEYDMPYPGLLPTSPFYPLKMLRDRVVGYLISDPLKRAEFSLLQADKRLQAGVALLLEDPQESSLALATISKGENYFDEAFHHTALARRQKRDVYDMGVKLSVAARKHEEILINVSRSIPSREKDSYERELSRIRQNIEKAKPYMKKR
jgi:hypothetical protein